VNTVVYALTMFGELGYYKGSLSGFSNKSKPHKVAFGVCSIREFHKISG